MDKFFKNQRIKEKRKKCFSENTVSEGMRGKETKQPRKEKEEHSYENNSTAKSRRKCQRHFYLYPERFVEWFDLCIIKATLGRKNT